MKHNYGAIWSVSYSFTELNAMLHKHDQQFIKQSIGYSS